MRVLIYKPVKSTMQSGARGHAAHWVLECMPDMALQADPLMGWAGSCETERQVRLRFPTAEAAIHFAQERGWTYDCKEEQPRALKIQSYADNFR